MSANTTFAPLVWTKVYAGRYTATDRFGNVFLARKIGNEGWSLFINDDFSSAQAKLSQAKRWAEVNRKHLYSAQGNLAQFGEVI